MSAGKANATYHFADGEVCVCGCVIICNVTFIHRFLDYTFKTFEGDSPRVQQQEFNYREQQLKCTVVEPDNGQWVVVITSTCPVMQTHTWYPSYDII